MTNEELQRAIWRAKAMRSRAVGRALRRLPWPGIGLAATALGIGAVWVAYWQ